MIIAIIAHSLHPIKEPFEGGLEMITHLLCTSLIKRGHTIHLYAHPLSDEELNVHPLGPIDGNTPSFIGGANSAVIDKDALKYRQTMEHIKNLGYDIVHNMSLHYIPIILGNELNTNFITSFHTPIFPFLEQGIHHIKNDSRQTFTMVSESLKKTWSKLVPKATVIYNGIKVGDWPFVEFPKGDYLFWYGRICPEKGTHLAIEAAVKAGLKLVFAGPKSNLEYYTSEIEPLLGHPNIEFLGHITQEEIKRRLSNARATLFTSVWEEPYGLVLAESLACGTPVVSFNKGAAAEILTEKTGIIVESVGIYGLIRAIHAARKLNRHDCRDRALDFCSHEAMVSGYITLYENLVSDKNLKFKRAV